MTSWCDIASAGDVFWDQRSAEESGERRKEPCRHPATPAEGARSCRARPTLTSWPRPGRGAVFFSRVSPRTAGQGTQEGPGQHGLTRHGVAREDNGTTQSDTGWHGTTHGDTGTRENKRRYRKKPEQNGEQNKREDTVSPVSAPVRAGAVASLTRSLTQLRAMVAGAGPHHRQSAAYECRLRNDAQTMTRTTLSLELNVCFVGWIHTHTYTANNRALRKPDKRSLKPHSDERDPT